MIKFEPKERDSLYYDKFEYCIQVQMPDMYLVRSLDHDDIDRTIQYRSEMNLKSPNLFKSYENVDRNRLHDVCDLLKKLKEKRGELRFVFEYGGSRIYTSDLSVIQEIDECPYFKHKEYTQAIVTMPKGSIRIKSSPHKFRTYFRYNMMDETKRNEIVTYLKSQPDLRLSPSLVYWSRFGGTWVRGNYFIDHNNASDLMFLRMIHAGLLGKMVNIVN